MVLQMPHTRAKNMKTNIHKQHTVLREMPVATTSVRWWYARTVPDHPYSSVFLVPLTLPMQRLTTYAF